MGNRIHIHIKHEIEYGEEGFNWQIEGLRMLLEKCGCYINDTLNEDCIGEWEIYEGEFQNAVKQIEGMTPKEVCKYFDNSFLEGDTMENTKKYVVDMLRKFEITGDHHKGYYHFSWF